MGEYCKALAVGKCTRSAYATYGRHASTHPRACPPRDQPQALELGGSMAAGSQDSRTLDIRMLAHAPLLAKLTNSQKYQQQQQQPQHQQPHLQQRQQQQQGPQAGGHGLTGTHPVPQVLRKRAPGLQLLHKYYMTTDAAPM